MNKAQELLNISNEVNSKVDISSAIEFIYLKCEQAAKRGSKSAAIKFSEINKYLGGVGNVHDKVMSELREQGFMVTIHHTGSDSYLQLSWLSA